MNIQTGKLARPQKVVIYGPEGVGKTTLAAQFPLPVFIDTERGTHHIDVARFADISKWDDIAKAIADLAQKPHSYKTLVLDTIDWAEKRLIEHICTKARKDSVEDFGYGKGYVVIAEEFAKFLVALDGLLTRGVNVVLLAHATVRKFEAPDQAGSFDRYELKLSKQVAPLVKEWADMLLFANYETRLIEGDNGKVRAAGGKDRIMHTTHTAAYDAKNRHGFADKVPCEFASIAHVFGAVEPQPLPPAIERIKPIQRLLAGKSQAQRDKVTVGAITRGWIKSGETYLDIPANIAAQAVAFPEKFFAAFEI